MSPSPASPAAAAAPPALSWGVCVATLNRVDALARMVTLALAQTRPPSEVIVVDASADWQANARRIEDCMAAHPAVRLCYLGARARSSARQRNQGLAEARAAILFLIDDDTFLHADAAARVMAIYEADRAGAIAAVGLSDSPENPDPHTGAQTVAHTGSGPAPDLQRRLMASRLVRAFSRTVLLRSRAGTFVPYTTANPRHDAAQLALPDGVTPTDYIGGCMLTVRRRVALAEPFEPALLAYSPAEDFDACHRYATHGVLVRARDARAHHAKAAGGRLKHREVAHLTMANLGFYVRKNSVRPARDGARLGVYALRRMLAEGLKDAISLQPGFPRFRGALGGSLDAARLWRVPRDRLLPWYEARQRAILGLAAQPADPDLSLNATPNR